MACLALWRQPRAHEIPNEVTVQTFLRPEGRTLTFLVRAPLKAMRDVDIPLRENGFLDLARVRPTLEDAAMLWIGDFVELFENGRPLAKPAGHRRPRVAALRQVVRQLRRGAGQPDRPAAARRHRPSTGRTACSTCAFAYDIQSDQSRFAIRPGLTRLGLRVNVVMRLLTPGNAERAFDVHGDPGIVELDPRWHQAALRFTKDGFFHILDGIDHLLFLFCLVIPFRRLRPLVAVVTAFTVAHSITLIASAFDMAPSALWFPPLIETLIAASIVYMAIENITGAHLQRRWVVTFAFGLVHGFGFSFALRESLQFAGSHLLTSLLAFNVGVELGQLLVLVVMLPVLGVAVHARRRRADRHDHPVGVRRAHRVALADASAGRAACSTRCSGRSSTWRSLARCCAGRCWRCWRCWRRGCVRPLVGASPQPRARRPVGQSSQSCRRQLKSCPALHERYPTRRWCRRVPAWRCGR